MYHGPDWLGVINALDTPMVDAIVAGIQREAAILPMIDSGHRRFSLLTIERKYGKLKLTKTNQEALKTERASR